MQAAVAAGANSPLLSEFRSKGGQGQHAQNLERDIFRQMLRIEGIPDPLYKAEKILIHKQSAQGNAVAEAPWYLLLPHEIFGLLWSKKRALFNQVFATSSNSEYWTNAFRANFEWLRVHPLREKIRQDFDTPTAFRMFGDDTGISKNCERPVSCLTWDADGCTLDIWKRELPVYIIPEFLCVAGLTKKMLDEIDAWSFNCLIQGKLPERDHQGRKFPQGSWRAKFSGQPLTADHRYGVLSAGVGDWKYNHETYEFEQYWGNKDELCNICDCKASGVADFEECTKRSHADYMARIGHKIPLCSITGWHLPVLIHEAGHFKAHHHGE